MNHFEKTNTKVQVTSNFRNWNDVKLKKVSSRHFGYILRQQAQLFLTYLNINIFFFKLTAHKTVNFNI